MLQGRLTDLKRQLDDADRALQEYRVSSNLPGGTGSLYSAQMSGLNSRLIAARIALVESKARIEHDQQSIRGGKPHAATPDNDVIARLRAQYLELGVAASEMESRVGADHNAVIKVRMSNGARS